MVAPKGKKNSNSLRTKCPKGKEDLSALMAQSPEEVKHLLHLLQEASDFQNQINCLQKWTSDLESLASLFFLLPLKSSLRRSIASKIKNSTESVEVITSYFLKELKKYEGNAFMRNVIKCCDDNNDILKTVPIHLSIEPFINNLTETLSTNNESELSETLRALSYARTNPQSTIFEAHPDLKHLLHKIVQSQNLSTDTRGKSAKILISEEILCQSGYDILLNILSLVKDTSSPYYSTNIESELIYYYGIVTSTSFLCIINRVLLEYKKISHISDLCSTSVVTLSRGFLRCSNVLLSRTQEWSDKNILCCIEEFIWDYLDYPMDSIKYNVKNVLKDYIKIKYQMDALEDLVLKILKWDEQDKRRYIVLTPVIKFGGCKIIWFVLKKSVSFKETVIANLSDSCLRSSCTELYKTCLNQVEDHDKWAWLKPVIDGYKMDTGNLCRRNHLDVLVKEIIKQGGSSISDALVNDLLIEDNRSPTSTCIALQSLKTIKLLKASEFYFEDCSFINECMTDLSDQVRLEAFDFIVSSLKTSEVLKEAELNLILEYGIKANMLVSDPPLQMQFLAITKKFLCRLNESFAACNRGKREEDVHTCQSYIQILKKLNDWIVLKNLSRPLVHLYFRTLGFEILFMCSKIFGKESKLYSLNSEHGVVLVECLKSESHDKNCDTILQILETFYEGNRSIVNFSNETIINLLRTPMPRNGIIAQYLTNVLRICKYDEEFENVLFEEFVSQLSRAKSSLINASFEGPIYGVLGCLKGGRLIESLVDYCFEIWDLVSPIVNDSSPEGFSQESDDSLECDSQLLLLLAWRTTKEVCDLFQIVATRSEANADILKISKFFIQVFSETKHRGVFERAYTGFCTICNLLWLHDDLKIRQFPRKLLHETLETISLVGDDVTVTRRSAGYPFLIQALISSEPGMSSFDHVMEQLLEWSSSSSWNMSLKVHAYNILRAIYKDSLLGDKVMKYISRGIQTAILGFKSSFWPIRNSSTLLFSSLITRLFGVKRDQDDLSEKNGSYTYKIFFERFPELYHFFLEQLDASQDETSPSLNCTTIFPTLLVLAKLKMTPCLVSSKIAVELHHLQNQIISFLSHPVLKIRHLASYALCALSSEESELRLAKVLAENMATSLSSSNALHGILFFLNLMIKKNSKIKQVIMSYFQDQLKTIPIRSPLILIERLKLFELSEPKKKDLIQELSQIKGSNFPHPGKHLYYRLLLEKSVQWALLSRNEDMSHFLMTHNPPMYFEILLNNHREVESFALCLNKQNKENRIESCRDLNEFQCFLRLFLNTNELDCQSSIWKQIIHFLESKSIMYPINFDFLQLCVKSFTKLVNSFDVTQEELLTWSSYMKKWILLDCSIVLKRSIALSISESTHHLKSINESNSKALVALLLWFVLLNLSLEEDYALQKIIYKILVQLWGTKRQIIPNQMHMELCDWLLMNSSVYVSETKYVLNEAFEVVKDIDQIEKTDDETLSLAFEKRNEHVRYDDIDKIQEKIRIHYDDAQLTNEQFQLRKLKEYL